MIWLGSFSLDWMSLPQWGVPLKLKLRAGVPDIASRSFVSHPPPFSYLPSNRCTEYSHDIYLKRQPGDRHFSNITS